MQPRTPTAGRRRPGKILVMSALLLPVFLGGMALSIDYGVLSVAQGQLRAAADGAALAGVMKLATDTRVRNSSDISSEMASARAQAAAIAASNRVLGQAPVVLDNASNASSGDVVVGYLNPASPGSGLVTS